MPEDAEEGPVGCGAPRKKLEDDLKSGADDSIISDDVTALKKCLVDEPDEA